MFFILLINNIIFELIYVIFLQKIEVHRKNLTYIYIFKKTGHQDQISKSWGKLGNQDF